MRNSIPPSGGRSRAWPWVSILRRIDRASDARNCGRETRARIGGVDMKSSGQRACRLAFLAFVATLISPAAAGACTRPSRRRRARQPARQGDQPLPAAARPQPGRLVSLGARGVRQGEGREQADLPLGRLQLVLLVPRHGARELHGRRDRQGPQRAASSASRSTARSGPTSTRST